ncbi:MAG TPA: class I adenylate-forming enzyme family protein, partial [Brevundimonas sp.]|nr:class I adenylate-forming enzyme family protein [Brevundimonas sp.]
MTDTTTRPWPALPLAHATAALTAPGSPFEVVDAVIEGRPYKIWKNAPPTLLHSFMAGRAWGERTFIVYGEERVSFEAFARATLALAADLKARGVKKGDRVAIAMRNLPEWPVAFFASTLLGAVATPLNAWWTGAELAYGLADSGSTVAVVDIERLERIAPHLPELTALTD